MNPTDFGVASPGELVATIDGARAFVPRPLPPGLDLPGTTVKLLGEARAALGALNEAGRYLPNPELFIHPLQKQEAVLSNRIEGTRTTLEEAFVQEAAGLPGDEDAREVSNYERALRDGVSQLLAGRSLSFALIRDLHRTVTSGVRGKDKLPGAFRQEQVWIGGVESRADINKARFVPPPGVHVQACIDALEMHMLAETEGDALVKIALTHYQFETIHPFADGNGRVGRLLIVLQSLHERLLTRPWLYVSPFLESERDAYYGLLYRTSSTGDFISWVEFFLLAVRESAIKTLTKVQRLRELDRRYRQELAGLQSQKPVQLLDQLQSLPYITVPIAQDVLGVKTPNTARAAIQKLVELKILEEMDWKPRLARGRPPVVYRCKEIVDLVQA